MIKIILTERRTISASKDLVDSLSSLYKSNYLKLVEIYLKYKHEKKIESLKNNDKDLKTSQGSDIYQVALKKLKSQYGDMMRMKSPISPADFKRQIESNFQKKVIYKIAVLPGANIVPHILKQDTSLNAFKSAGIDFESAAEQIGGYLQNKRKKDINIFLELSAEKENYHGLMDFDAMSISVNYDIDLFKRVLFFERDIDSFFSDIEKQLVLTKRSAYHEVQHLFADIVKGTTGFSTYGSAPRSATRGDIPDSDPEEVQTYAQDSVTFFNEMIENLSIKPEQLNAAKAVLLKTILNSSLSSAEQELYKSLDQNIIKKYINAIKNRLELIKKYNQKFYNYALEILFSSVRDDKELIDPLTRPLSQRYGRNIQENIIMNKIKVVLKESSLINEELTKDEIRKLVRDELEKLLKNSDIKKDLTKLTKDFVKKFYKELSVNSTYFIDRIDA